MARVGPGPPVENRGPSERPGVPSERPGVLNGSPLKVSISDLERVRIFTSSAGVGLGKGGPITLLRLREIARKEGLSEEEASKSTRKVMGEILRRGLTSEVVKEALRGKFQERAGGPENWSRTLRDLQGGKGPRIGAPCGGRGDRGPKELVLELLSGHTEGRIEDLETEIGPEPGEGEEERKALLELGSSEGSRKERAERLLSLEKRRGRSERLELLRGLGENPRPSEGLILTFGLDVRIGSSLFRTDLRAVEELVAPRGRVFGGLISGFGEPEDRLELVGCRYAELDEARKSQREAVLKSLGLGAPESRVVDQAVRTASAWANFEWRMPALTPGWRLALGLLAVACEAVVQERGTQAAHPPGEGAKGGR